MNFITCISCLLLKGWETRLPQTAHCCDTFPKQKACAEGRVEAGLEEAGKDSVPVSALCLMPRFVWFKDFCTGEWHHTRGSVMPA